MVFSHNNRNVPMTLGNYRVFMKELTEYLSEMGRHRLSMNEGTQESEGTHSSLN